MNLDQSRLRPATIAGLCLLLLILGPSLVAAGKADQDRPRIGLVLSGGGARGAAHIGVLRELERLRVPIDYIVGTSMGAIVAGLYASSLSADEIDRALRSIDWDLALSDRSGRNKRPYRRKQDDSNILVDAAAGLNNGRIEFPMGLLEGQNLGLILKRLTIHVSHIHDFDKLSIPYRAVASDISTGQPVVLGSGDLALAMRASMSVPGAFSPVEIDDKLLVDGGVSDNLPIGVARKMGADLIIAVDISTPLSGKAEMKSLFSVTEQLSSILTRSNTERSLATLTDRDILIVPELGNITSTDFKIAYQAIESGLKAAEAKSGRLKRLAIDKRSFQQLMAHRASISKEPPVVDFIEINNQTRLDDKMLSSRLSVPLGRPLDLSQLDAEIERLYGVGLFQRVSYDIVESQGQDGVRVDVVEKPWGPNYLQGGIAFEALLSGANTFNVAAGYTRTAINPLGGEWRTILQLGNDMVFFSELYQPLDTAGGFFINPFVNLERYNQGIYLDDDLLSQDRISRASLALAGGYNLGNWGRIATGFSWSRGDIDRLVGDPTVMDQTFREGDFFVRLSVDSMDNINFPSSGLLGNISWTAVREGLGSDYSFDQYGVALSGATGFDRHSILLSTRVGVTQDDNAPFQDLFTLGGFGNLSGLAPRQLLGQDMGLLVAAYHYRVADFQLAPMYLGGTLEAGNTWNDKHDFGDELILAGSIFLGFDTFLGPVYFGYGHAEGNNNAFYFYLGNPFTRHGRLDPRLR